MDIEIKKDVYTEISNLLKEARKSIVSNINTTMKNLFFNRKKNCRRRAKWK